MTNFQIIWTMVTTLLTAYYDPVNVFNAYQNNYTLPTHNNFAIITQKDIAQAALPLRDFDVINQQKVLTGFGDWEFQVDLYGDNADTAANILHIYVLASAASNYLLPFQLGIGKVKMIPPNISKVNDRDNYMKRYIVIFTVLNTNIVKIPMAGISYSDVELNFTEYT